MAHRRIGQILVDLGYITDEQLELLVDEHKQHPDRLIGQVAMEMGLVTDEQLAQALAEQLSMRTITLSDLDIPRDILELVTEPMAQMYKIIPVEFDGSTLTVAMCEPQNLGVQDELRTFLGFSIQVVVSTEQDVLKTLSRYYSGDSDSVESIVADMEADAEHGGTIRYPGRQ